jgi:hypothetical protein
VQRIDGVRNAFLIDDHENFRVQGDKILMRNAISFTVRQRQRERVKSITQPLSDLLDYQDCNLPPGGGESRLHAQIVFAPFPLKLSGSTHCHSVERGDVCWKAGNYGITWGCD